MTQQATRKIRLRAHFTTSYVFVAQTQYVYTGWKYNTIKQPLATNQCFMIAHNLSNTLMNPTEIGRRGGQGIGCKNKQIYKNG